MQETITPTNILCPICGEGTLVVHVEEDVMEYHGVTKVIPCQFKVCTACGSEQADAEDMRVNKRTMQAFKKEVDGLLTGQQVRNIRERLGLTQAEAASLFGGGPVAFSAKRGALPAPKSPGYRSCWMVVNSEYPENSPGRISPQRYRSLGGTPYEQHANPHLHSRGHLHLGGKFP